MYFGEPQLTFPAALAVWESGAGMLDSRVGRGDVGTAEWKPSQRCLPRRGRVAVRVFVDLVRPVARRWDKIVCNTADECLHVTKPVCAAQRLDGLSTATALEGVSLPGSGEGW